MVSVSFMSPGEASRFPPPFLPAAPGLERLSRPVRDHRHRPLFPQQPVRRHARHHAVAAVQRDRRLRLRQTALQGPRPDLPAAASPRSSFPAQVTMLPLFLMLKEMGLINSFAGVLVPVADQHLRHLPGPPICAVDPRRDARGGAGRRRGRGADLPPDRGAGADPDPDHAGPVHLPRQPGTTSCGR